MLHSYWPVTFSEKIVHQMKALLSLSVMWLSSFAAPQHLLEPHEVEYVATSQHRPLAVLQALTHLLVAAKLDPIRYNLLDDNLLAQEDILGACERILKTPIPLSYTRYLK
jgi:predicted membrane chloride channel (bestrophin family)